MMPMSDLEIVKTIQQAAAAGNMESGAAYYKKDFTLREAPSLPYGGTYRGSESLETFIKRHYETWSEHTFEVLSYVDAGNGKVICLVKLLATSRATGRKVEMLVTEWWTLEESCVVDIHEFYFDTAKILEVISP